MGGGMGRQKGEGDGGQSDGELQLPPLGTDTTPTNQATDNDDNREETTLLNIPLLIARLVKETLHYL